MRDETYFVYVISIDEYKLSKIGISNKPSKRLKQLSTWSPFKMRIAMTIAVPDFKCAKYIESTFHSACKKDRRNGEWFDMGADLACVLMAMNFTIYLNHTGSLTDDELELAFHCAGIDPKYTYTLKVAEEEAERSVQ